MNSKDIHTMYQNDKWIYKVVLLIFLCVLYAFYEFRIYAEMTFIFMFCVIFIRRPIIDKKYIIWSCSFLLICLLSILWSRNQEQSIIEVRIIIEGIIIGVLLTSFIDSSDKIIYIYKCLIISGIILSIRLIISVPPNMWGIKRLGSTFINANQAGILLSISTMCCMQLNKIKKKKINIVLIPIFIALIFLTGSRKAFLIVIIGIFTLYLLNENNALKRFKASIIIIILGCILYKLIMEIPIFYEVLGSRIETMMNFITKNGMVDGSIEERVGLINIAKQLFLEKPILGYGIGSYSKVSGYGIYSHNNYFELLVGVGVIGTAIYYTAYIYLILTLVKMRMNGYKNIILIVMLMLTISEYALVNYNDPIYQFIIVLAFSIVRVGKNDVMKSNINYIECREES